MTTLASLSLLKFVLMTGFALWMVVIVVNNVAAFAGGVASVGGMMAMQLFDQEPKIRTPLLARRVVAPAWHRLTYLFILAVEIGVAALLVHAAIGFAGAGIGWHGAGEATMRANLALSGLVAMAFIMALGGAWFAYYIRQEAMQITHFVLIGVALAAAILVNLPVGLP